MPKAVHPGSREAALRAVVRGHDALLVAYSGGVDSALVLAIAHAELGDRAIGVTADSPALPRAELETARRIAGTIGARHRVVPTHELDDPRYASNPPDRCFHCKTELYRVLATVAAEEGVRHVANGTNVDDLGDYRPGLRAAEAFRVVSPLRDAGLAKHDVRAVARSLGIEVWDKPASPCLASRIPYGAAVTRDRLQMIELAEAHLHASGFDELRVRHFGATARIELPAADLKRLRRGLDSTRARFRAIGFAGIELAVFESGALNAQLADVREQGSGGR